MQSKWKINVSLKRESVDAWFFKVTVKNETGFYEFTVEVQKDYYEELTDGKIIPLVLVQQSILFLLSKEEPHEILDEFKLSDITNYFKDFEQEIRQSVQHA